MEHKLLTEKEVAALLSISHETLKKARQKGKSPRYVVVGRCIRYTMSDIEDYIRQNTVS